MAYYIKYIIALFWILLWILDIAKSHMTEKRNIFAMKKYSLPLVFISIWSLIIYIVDRPIGFSSEYVSRMFSNVIYLILTYASALSGIHFFGKKAIKLSAIAMLLSVSVNTGFVIGTYGINMFFNYLPNVFSTTDYVFGSTSYNFALALEVQDITIATGFYLIYFIFLDEDDSRKTRIRYILLMLFCAIIGFKRTTLVGFLIVAVLMWFIKKKNVPFKYIVYMVGVPFILVSFIYIMMIKYNWIEDLSLKYNIDANGRVNIYKILATYYDINVFYLGKGFTFVDKNMYESIGFAAHSVIVKMFAEIGFLPFLVWIWHYLVKIPKVTEKQYGKKSGEVSLAMTLYLFITYFMENTMSLFCIQYSFILIPLVVDCIEERSVEVKNE